MDGWTDEESKLWIARWIDTYRYIDHFRSRQKKELGRVNNNVIRYNASARMVNNKLKFHFA